MKKERKVSVTKQKSSPKKKRGASECSSKVPLSRERSRLLISVYVCLSFPPPSPSAVVKGKIYEQLNTHSHRITD